MNSSTGEVSRKHMERIRAKAAVWMARRHSGTWDSADEAALRRWQAENPAHSIQFELAQRVWSETRAMTGPLPPKTLLWPVLSAVTVTLLMAVTVAVWVGVHLRAADVVTGVGEQRTLTLSDGTRVILNTRTRFREHYDAQRREVTLESGEAYFEVTKHERRPFVVVAGDRKVLAVGTSFTVRRDDGSDTPLAVTLIEGRVAIAPTDAPLNIFDSASFQPTPGVTTLRAGERAKFRGTGAPIVDAPPLDTVTSWRTGSLHFVNTPLAEAVAEFNRYSRKHIIVRSPKESTLKVSGLFASGDALSFVRSVAATKDMTLRVRNDALILESP